jgi:NADP-dependent 3-hydroxy acid dehydrogenase YdfG
MVRSLVLVLAGGGRLRNNSTSGRTIADRLPKNDRLLTVALDVTDEASIASALTAATDKFGRIDVLLNNAGHCIVGAVE